MTRRSSVTSSVTQFPINRACPLTGERDPRLVGYIPATLFCAANPTYRQEFTDILGISAGDEFPIVENRSGFVFSGWCPPDEFLKKLYENVIDHSKTITETFAYRRGLLEFAAVFLRIVEQTHCSATKPLRLLDFGCGYGSLARMLHGRDIQCCGYERSIERSSRARQGGLDVSDSLENVADRGPFDLLVCTEVLEHVADPREVLRYLKRNAAPGALLAITVPQCEASFVSECFDVVAGSKGAFSRLMNPWEHLNYFSAQTLRGLLIEEGFEPVHDFGRARLMHSACLQVVAQTALKSRVSGGLGIMRALSVKSESTQLICRTE